MSSPNAVTSVLPNAEAVGLAAADAVADEMARCPLTLVHARSSTQKRYYELPAGRQLELEPGQHPFRGRALRAS